MATKIKQGKVTIDDLATMVQSGFNELSETTRKGLEGVTKEMKAGSEQNARDHEEIKLRLDNVAYRFELVELEKRVEVIEKKVSVRHR